MEQFKFTLLAFHILLLLSGSQTFSFTACKEFERKDLLKFKQSFTDRSNRLASWVGEDCCRWEGVRCHNAKGNVVALDLRCYNYDSVANNLSSPSTELEAFTMDSALLELKHLKYLDLSGNNFNGIQVPHFIGSMKQLQYLNLSLAKFGGEVPHQLGNLSNLRVLDLFNSGDYPMEANLMEWTFGLQSLQYLDMSGIDLSQALDTIQLLHKPPSLLYLRLSSCLLGNAHLTQTLQSSTRRPSILQHLDVSDNLFDIPIPQVLANLSSLRVLDLSFNFLSSSVPSWLRSRTSLQNLNLSGNNLTSVEGGILGLLAELCDLKSLYLSFNHLEDEMSDSQVNFSRCEKYDLETAFMSVNNISGHLSSWLGNFRRLRYLDLRSNSLSGGIPQSLETLSSLRHLDLSHNHLSGDLPRSLGSLPSLEWLDISNNNLNGIVREVNFAHLSRLTYLDLSSNPLALEIASNWYPPFQLQTLLLKSVKINTTFPQWLQTQKKISSFDMSNVGIFGSLPDNIDDLFPSLKSFRLADNRLSGSVPQSLCRLTNLEVLDIRNNQLTGMIPDCWSDSQTLEVIDLSLNELSGPLPVSLSSVASLQSLSLNNNKLNGEIPFSSTNWPELLILDVGENTFSGKIPPWSEINFPKLQVLRLRDNKLKGPFPPQLCSLQKLQIIDLAHNRFSGAIPECFGNFSAMASLQVLLAGPINVGPFPSEGSVTQQVKGVEEEYTTNLGLFVNMDLSSNNLVGTIPTELTNLHSLLGLNLSYNHLSGPIPEMIGRMKSLEFLDLSNNHISGTIPKSLSGIDTLEYLNLSYNNLHGQIPTGNQLQTLNDPSIYKGNPGLCGDPLPKECIGHGSANRPAIATSATTDHDVAASEQEKQWFFIAMPLGFVTGFWGVVGILLLNTSWRVVYFKLAEDIADRILN